MESRKKRNLEIERAKRQKRLVFTGILTCMMILVVAALGYAVWDIVNRRTIMTLNGERIATTDFRFFHVMQQIPPGELAQENALGDLTQTLLILERAEMHGVGATNEELAELMEQAAEFRAMQAQMVPGGINFISERRVAELLSAWSQVFERLSDIYMSDFIPDEEAYQAFMAESIEGIRLNSTEIQIKYVASADWFEMDDISHELEQGAEFDDFAGAETVSIMEFAETYDAWISPELDNIFQTQQAGDISDIFEVEGMYFIVKVYDRIVDEANVAIMTEIMRENFLMEERAEAFFDLTNEWVDQADRDVNMRAISRF
ncbi:MAG: peptidylprolyl isomerase [Defluviitaleaceae bacterium]|nr:peptidylprolyl isomerase [Defluviitaleaceae bacterium]